MTTTDVIHVTLVRWVAGREELQEQRVNLEAGESHYVVLELASEVVSAV